MCSGYGRFKKYFMVCTVSKNGAHSFVCVHVWQPVMGLARCETLRGTVKAFSGRSIISQFLLQ